jgi:hypothetical protein
VIHDLRQQLPDVIGEELAAAIRELTEPDPVRRGHPANISGAGPRYGVERYISRFDLLQKRFDVRGTRGAA